MINTILERLDSVKKSGHNKWLAKCPAHDDKSPSLGVKLIDDKVLLHCFAGCRADDIMHSVGLEVTDLFQEKTTYSGNKTQRPRFNASELIELCARESCILSLALMDCFNGKTFSDIDRARISQAMTTVSNIRREVSR